MRKIDKAWAWRAGWAALWLVALPLQAATFYVSPGGDDNGSQARPFRSLAGACDKAPSGANTIRLSAGLFHEARSCLIPSGVSVLGAGADRTTLFWSATEDLEENPRRIAPDKFLIQMRDSSGASLSRFRMDGGLGSGRAHGGILARRVSRVQIHDITARSFNLCGIYLTEATGSSVYHCDIEDCGHPSRQSCSGGIQVGDLTDSSVHDCLIREHRGAYGIKGWRFLWGDQDPSGPGDLRLRLVRAAFYRNDIRVRQQGGWGNGQPNMALELWNSRPERCEIYENRFNECVSLAGGFSAPQTIHVHDNQFILEPGYSYALEVEQNNMEVDHNYFANGYYPLACFTSRKEGLRIHHNIFDGIEKIQLLYFAGGVRDFQFVNNTVYLQDTFPMLVMGGRSEGILIANNLFYKTGDVQAPPLIVLQKDGNGQQAAIGDGTLQVTRNAFWRWAPEGVGAVTANPRLALSGPRTRGDFFRPLPGSPLLGSGLSVPGVTSGPRPGIGAVGYPPRPTGW